MSEVAEAHRSFGDRAHDGDQVQRDFRLAMRRVAAPVSVVTTVSSGRPVGVTVSAFDSLSMSPPMMTVVMQRGSSLLSAIREGSALGVNVLQSTQSDLAVTFAMSGVDRFAAADWWLDRGAPRLAGVHAWIALRVRQFVPGGDHVVVVGDVVESGSGGGEPLVYYDRRFGTHLAC